MKLKNLTDAGRKSVAPRTPQTDTLQMEMPLKPEDLKILFQNDLGPGTKPWVALIPAGKEGLSMLALSRRSFTVQEKDDRFVIHPKLK